MKKSGIVHVVCSRRMYAASRDKVEWNLEATSALGGLP